MSSRLGSTAPGAPANTDLNRFNLHFQCQLCGLIAAHGIIGAGVEAETFEGSIQKVVLVRKMMEMPAARPSAQNVRSNIIYANTLSLYATCAIKCSFRNIFFIIR